MADEESALKERRKQLRRDRIVAGKDAQNCSDDAPSGDKSSAKTGEEYPSDQAVEASFQRLDNSLEQSTSRVTECRVKTDQREARRRADEQADHQKREELLKQLQDSRHDDEVASGWKQCVASTNVQDLVKLLDGQQATCESALAKLQDIGKELGSELREKDHEYVTALKTNRQEIEALQECIAEEHNKLKDAFERELRLIEASLAADRNYILNTNREELEALIAKRDRAEEESLERQRQIIDEHRKEIEESEAQGERDREDLKKKLESEVRRLEIELEDTKARHGFDTDKLEYNVRVLTELSESEEAVKKQKRRIMKGKEELNRELEEKQRAKSKGMRQNELLEGDCERIEKQSSGLREKFERFKVSDDEKYRAVLGMHRDDLRKLQGELKQSQDFIFDGAIGCCEAAEQSCTSDLTLPDDIKSNKTNECKCLDGDEFGLESANNAHFNESFEKRDDWRQAESLLSNYRTILERREGLDSEAAAMERQNDELEAELRSKLKEKVNEELAFPPSSMISVGGET